MSAKSKRLANRLRIEAERLAAVRKEIKQNDSHLRAREVAVALSEAGIRRALLLRMFVSPPTDRRSFGDAYQLTILLWPEEYRLRFMYGSPSQSARNVTAFAQMESQLAACQIREIIERCLTGQLEEFVKTE